MMATTKQLVILDRDGVINADRADFVQTPDEWVPIPGSLEAIARLNQQNNYVVIATNQSGIGRGYYTQATLATIHQKMYRLLAKVGGHIDGLFFCPHHPDDACACRKPKTGLIDQIKQQFPFIPHQTWFIGDSLRDMQAAEQSQCVPVLVQTGHGQKTLAHTPVQNWLVFKDLAEAAQSLPEVLHLDG